MHGLFFAGEKQIQIGCRGVNCPGCYKEANAQEPIDALLERSGKFAHQPEGKATQIPAKSAHEKHDDSRDERAGDDTSEEESGAVNLASAAAEEIDRGNGGSCAKESAKRSQ